MISHFGKFVMVLVCGIVAAILGLYPFLASIIPFKMGFLVLSITQLIWVSLIIGALLITFSALYLDDTFMWSFIVLGILTALPALLLILVGFGILPFTFALPAIIFQLLLILNAIGFGVALVHGTD